MSQFPLWIIVLIILMIYSCYNFEIIEAPPMPMPMPRVNTSDFNFSEQIFRETFPRDFNFSSPLNNLYLSSIIAKELIGLNETEIKDYPLTDLPAEEIKSVFTILNSGNLSKILLNIEDNDIKNLYDKLTPLAFNKIIEKISESSKIKIQNRLP